MGKSADSGFGDVGFRCVDMDTSKHSVGLMDGNQTVMIGGGVLLVLVVGGFLLSRKSSTPKKKEKKAN
jgi:hypothetical protein